MAGYKDYKPIRKGQFGYSKTSRRYYNAKTDTIIGRSAYESLKRGGLSRGEAIDIRERKLMASPPTRSLIKRYQEEHKRGRHVPTELETIRSRGFKQLLEDQRLLRRKFSRNVIDRIQERENVAGRYIDTAEDVLKDKRLRREVNREIRRARLDDTKEGYHQRLADYTRNLNREVFRAGSEDYIAQDTVADSPEFIYWNERLIYGDADQRQEAIEFFDQESEDAAIDYGETP